MNDTILTCWFCGNDTYKVVVCDNDVNLVKMIKCGKCSETLFLSASINKHKSCDTCDYFEEPIKPRRAYCCENDSFRNATDFCSSWTAKQSETSENGDRSCDQSDNTQKRCKS